MRSGKLLGGWHDRASAGSKQSVGSQGVEGTGASWKISAEADLVIAVGTRPDRDVAVSYTRDVAPVIYANCTGCHRPGESAPFSLITYEDVRRRARTIVFCSTWRSASCLPMRA